jgi:hypothetical protein
MQHVIAAKQPTPARDPSSKTVSLGEDRGGMLVYRHRTLLSPLYCEGKKQGEAVNAYSDHQ